MYKDLKLVDSLEVEHVKCEDVKSSEVQDILNVAVPQMKGIMNAKDGVGIAAIQVGIKKNFSIYKLPESEKYNVIFNGKYISDGSRIQLSEGCLSYPNDNSTKTKRYKRIKAMYEIWNEKEKKFEKVTRRVKGVEAIILQHEIDHWNGKTIYI
jgi:peptide deformylase